MNDSTFLSGGGVTPNFHLIANPTLLEVGIFFVQGRPPPSRRVGGVIGAPLPDLITFQGEKKWCKLFISPRLL